jgi:hypothetical protein
MCSAVTVQDAAVVISRSQSTQIAIADEHADFSIGGADVIHRHRGPTQESHTERLTTPCG